MGYYNEILLNDLLLRRTVLTRPRTITKIKAELIDEHHFRIKMTTQAGTYDYDLLIALFNLTSLV
jgi:tRNA U54 and U55 pseudouridine synthase Pus10